MDSSRVVPAASMAENRFRDHALKNTRKSFLVLPGIRAAVQLRATMQSGARLPHITASPYLIAPCGALRESFAISYGKIAQHHLR